MLSLLTPAWLALLLAVPAIWWLHRSGQRAPPWRVADLALWSAASASDRTRGERRETDPAWIRRAAIMGLLAVALAQPVLLQPGQRVTLWVDDSLSMLTVEQGASRIEHGLERAGEELRTAGMSQVTVRTTSNPWRGYNDLDARTRGTIVEGAGRLEPQAPPPRLLQDGASHWLVTDGADTVLGEWLKNATVQRVLLVGTAKENAGITRIGARPALDDSSSIDVQIRVQNGGVTAERRRLELMQGDALLQHWDVALEPGSNNVVDTTIARSVHEVTARLVPGDALTEDDLLTLQLTYLTPVRTTVDPGCPASLVAALRNHPGLTVEASGPGLVISCDARHDAPARVPRIEFTVSSMPTPVNGELLWSQAVPKAARPDLASETLRAGGRLAPPSEADEVLLEADGEPLVILRNSDTRRIETSIDVDSPGFVGMSAFPMFVACLVDLALQRSMLEQVAVVDRGDAASIIVGEGTMVASPPPAATAGPPVAKSLAWPFLLLACVLLAWDLLVLARQFQAAPQETA